MGIIRGSTWIWRRVKSGDDSLSRKYSQVMKQGFQVVDASVSPLAAGE